MWFKILHFTFTGRHLGFTWQHGEHIMCSCSLILHVLSELLRIFRCIRAARGGCRVRIQVKKHQSWHRRRAGLLPRLGRLFLDLLPWFISGCLEVWRVRCVIPLIVTLTYSKPSLSPLSSLLTWDNSGKKKKNTKQVFMHLREGESVLELRRFNVQNFWYSAKQTSQFPPTCKSNFESIFNSTL